MRIFALALLCVLAIDPAAAKDTGLIFVSNEKSNNIIVIDPNSDKVVYDIKVGRRPRDLHSTPHTKLYVACGDDDVITIFDVATVKVTGKLKTGPSPEAFVIDETRRRIYISQEEGRRSPSSTGPRRDPEGSAHRRRARGRAAQRGRQDPLRHLGGGDLVHEVETKSAAITRDVVVGLRPRCFAATPDGKDLWVQGSFPVPPTSSTAPNSSSPAACLSCRRGCARPT